MTTLYPHAAIWFTLVLAVAVVGFWPSYFGRLRDTSALLHFHGVTAMAWLLMLIAQGWLFRSRRLRWHRLVGRGSLVLAPLLVVSGVLVTHGMLGGDSPFHRILGPRLAFIDLTTMIWFSVAYVLAIRHRRHLPLHARYMASTALMVLPPALSRMFFMLPGVDSFMMAGHSAYVVTIAATLALIVHDIRRLGRPSVPYLSLLVLFTLHLLAMNLIQHWPWWNRFCAWFAAF